jgi:hypothetical protein
VKEDGNSGNFDVTLAIKPMRYHIHGKTCNVWINGTAPFVSTEMSFSYDGKKYRHWQNSQAGTEMPTNLYYSEGWISCNLSDIGQDVSMFVTSNGASQGAGTGIPGFITSHTYDYYGARKISEIFQQWEKEKRVVHINKIPDSKNVEIEVRVDRIQGTNDFFLKFLYDPETNTVEHAELFSKFNGAQHVMTIYDVDFQTDESGNKFPKSVKEIHPLDNKVTITSYSSFNINPALLKDTFQLHFPDGVKVDDYITKQIYRVGDRVDEDKARKDFIHFHGLADNVPVRITTVCSILMTIGGLIILVGAILYIRKRRRTP